VRGYFRAICKREPEAQRRRIAAGACSDLMVISKTASAVRIDQIRRINEFFSYQAFEAGCKIAVICDAETMGEAAQNALLKTLEEPAAERIIILLATNTDNLLPTCFPAFKFRI
jgi:DNA polymerase-3 subunit delta'